MFDALVQDTSSQEAPGAAVYTWSACEGETIADAADRVRGAFKRSMLTRQIIKLIEETGDTAYASEVERYLLTIDDQPGEIFDLGRQLRGSRCLPSRALRRNVTRLKEFVAFAKEQDTSDWQFWNIGIPNEKAPVKDLKEELKRFNKSLNNELSELRKAKAIEILLIAIHIRFDPNSNLFDLHAHLVCRVPRPMMDLVQGRLGRKFSKSYLKDEPIRNVAAVVTYALWGVIDHSDLVSWPAEAFKAAWKLTNSRAQLVRSGGAFAAWLTREKKKKEQLTAEEKASRAKKRKNRRETAYDGPRTPHGDQAVAEGVGMVRGQQRHYLVVEKAAKKRDWEQRPTEATHADVNLQSNLAEAPTQEAPIDSSSATVDTIQGTQNSRPSDLISRGEPTDFKSIVHIRTTRTVTGLPWRKLAWWWRAWPYGGSIPQRRSESAIKSPSPIRRRTMRLHRKHLPDEKS